MKNRNLSGTLLVLALLSLTACGSKEKKEGDQEQTSEMAAADSKELKPTGEKPAWGPSIAPEMQVVVDKLVSYGAKPIPQLTGKEARMNPTPAKAVMDVMAEHAIPMPVAKSDTSGQEIPVSGGTIHARIYTPKEGTAPFPVIVYYHGGGWVIADLDTYNASAQGLCEQVGAVVVSVAYRQAPEYKFPVQHEDSFAAYQGVLNHASAIKGDAKRVAVVGESAGGNLAANMSIMARDKKVAMPVYQVLVYPIASNDVNSESYTKYAAAKPLDKPMMEWFLKQTVSNKAQEADPRIALVKANLSGLPATTLIGAEIDPLQSEGKLLADKLKEAGVKVDYKLFDGVTHEFFGMATVVPEAKEAQAYAADALKQAFKK
jgi:acetyl esterase